MDGGWPITATLGVMLATALVGALLGEAGVQRRRFTQRHDVQRRAPLGGIDDRAGEKRLDTAVQVEGFGQPGERGKRRAVQALAAEVEEDSAGLAGESGEAGGVGREERLYRCRGEPSRVVRDRVSQGW